MENGLVFPGYTVVGKQEIKIEMFFAGIFKKGAADYSKLSDLEQKASEDASAVIAIVGANLKINPADVFSLTANVFPAISKDNIILLLVTAANFIDRKNPINGSDWAAAIVKIQSYLEPYEGEQWKVIIKTVVLGIITILKPGNSMIQIIESALEYIYHLLVKPEVVKLLPNASPINAGA